MATSERFSTLIFYTNSVSAPVLRRPTKSHVAFFRLGYPATKCPSPCVSRRKHVLVYLAQTVDLQLLFIYFQVISARPLHLAWRADRCKPISQYGIWSTERHPNTSWRPSNEMDQQPSASPATGSKNRKSWFIRPDWLLTALLWRSSHVGWIMISYTL